MKARARVIDGFVRFGNRRDRKGVAAAGPGAPKFKILLAALTALAATLVLGVALGAAAAPVLTVEDAANVEYTTADVAGEVNPEDHETSYHFEYITDAQFSANVGNSEPPFQGAGEAGSGSLPENAGATPVSAQLTGLQPATEYHLRLVASNSEGETVAAEAASTFTTKAVAKPTVSGLAATETHFSGMVNPGAPGPAPQDPVFETHWEFTCSPGCSFSGAKSGTLEAGDAATEVGADPVNLTPNQAYDVTLHATNAGGEETETLAGAFTTPGLPPEIGDTPLRGYTSTSIVLAATVNPHNAPLSDCQFAYGQAGILDHSAPCELPLPEGEGKGEVRAAIEDLSPGSEYSFRLIATNGFGTSEGTIRPFRTGPACPNEAIRIAQHATQLGDCRAFEKVSPAEKGDGDVVGEGESTVASELGDGVVFESQMVFGDAVGSGNVGRTAYLARRASGGGWTTHAITPRHRPDALQVLAASTKFGVFSDDLSRTLVWAYDLPGVTDDTPNRENLYIEDTATGALQAVSISQEKELVLQDFLDPNIWGVSDDAKHLAFVTTTQMLPDAAPGKKTSNVYQWDDGKLSVAGVLPDGSVPPKGTNIKQKNVRSTMSADGSRLAFTSVADSQLYLRIDGDRTAWISQPEGSDTSTPTGVAFQGMTPDGRNVFFVSDSPLLDDDATPGANLYRWTDSPDPAKDANLTLITSDNSAQEDTSFGASLVGMSDDGSTVYIHGGDAKLKVWNGGPPTPRIIDPGVARSSEPKTQLTVLASQPGYGRVSADGNWLAYINDEDDQLHVYSLKADTNTCVSCPSTASLIPTVTNSSRVDYTTFRPRWMTDDGKVFFTSTGSLVPEDTNGVADTYEYDGPTGTLSLLSTGKGSEPAMFADASASGDDVFILTRQRLVPSDRDQYVDVYDVRVNGGVDESESVARSCSGENCQPAGAPSPAGPSISSAALGRGNLHTHRPCAKNKVRVNRKGKVTCVKKQHKRHAKHNRRASR